MHGRRFLPLKLTCLLGLAWMAVNAVTVAFAQSRLEQELLYTSADKLADQVVKSGDPSKGAILFHSPTLGCFQCHRVNDEQQNVIGPNLALWDKQPTTIEIIDSILKPSAKIDSKYASTRVLTVDGQVFNGVVSQRNSDHLQLRFGPKPDDQVTIAIDDIEREAKSEVSLMPTGLVQQLTDRAEFLDLVAYVQAIAAGGPAKAATLMPRLDQLKSKLPEYETHVDHAGLITSWNKDSLERGENIYRGLCINCHGTREAAGTLPTALRFGKGKFKQGSDPYAMYHTLTHGSGLMLPQIWMVPQQKYDVIHYIREHFLKPDDAASYTIVDKSYLKTLPKGDTRGPEPKVIQPWIDMDYGNVMATTIEFGSDGSNIAQKGIAFRLDEGPGGISQGKAWMAFEHDTMRWAAGWQGQGFINWQGIQFNGAHGIHPRAVGEIAFSNPTQPGWSNPDSDSFDDSVRVEGRDGKRYGPLPKSWLQYHGIRRDEAHSFVEYSVDQAPVVEHPFMIEFADSDVWFGRALTIAPLKRPQQMLVTTIPGKVLAMNEEAGSVTIDWEKPQGEKGHWVGHVVSESKAPRWRLVDNRLCLALPASKDGVSFSVAVANRRQHSSLGKSELQKLDERMHVENKVRLSLPAATAKSDDPKIDMPVRLWYEGNGWGVDELTIPVTNPWSARIRVTGLAFYPNQDAMAVCTWDGDVWRVTGLDSISGPRPTVQWQRIATGLFQPLGILAYEDHLMVTCRDQLMKLQDTNGDGVIDDYRCFNNDHQVTEHFHEFAMGLQQDAQGNFYYAKSARHALKAVVPHHGTLLQVSPDGERTEILATGFRAANGVCLNADGTFIVTDQEGHWNPKNRINWVERGKFYGNMFGYHSVTDSSDSAMEPPLCWITNSFDRSPAELLWVESPLWKELNGTLLNLSYGYGRVYVVPFETVEGKKQGGMCALPIPDLPTGIVRGKFSPRDGQLYVGGMYAWASSRQDQDGGLFRIRRTGDPVELPIGLHVVADSEGEPQIQIRFSDPLDSQSSSELDRYVVKAWDISRTANYGSNHLSERELQVTAARLLDDGKTIQLTVPDLQPTWCMSIDVTLKSSDGRSIHRLIHNTVHHIQH